MNAKEKRLGTKAQIRALKERERRIATAIFLAFILLIVIFSSYFTYNFLNQPQNQTANPASSQLKAAIVDHLSLTFPNQTFIETATNTLKQSGYTVEYYPCEKVTVEFYRNLSTCGYNIIILRVHSSASSEKSLSLVAFFSSELYDSRKYVYAQLFDQLAKASYTQSEPPYYFCILPPFFAANEKAKFKNSIIIMMGCEGLKYTIMAEAFIQKEAKTYIGWNGSVQASHTDQATTCLLQHLITQKETIKQAVDDTMEEVGPDPAYQSQLVYYPSE